MIDEHDSPMAPEPADQDYAADDWHNEPGELDEDLAPDSDAAGDAEDDTGEHVDLPIGAIGRVASPVRFESTSARWYFWVAPGALVEKTQLVWTSSKIAAQSIRFFGTVSEVFRRSRKRSIDDEIDTYDGDLKYLPPFAPEGVTFAEVAMIGIEPAVLTPPLEQSLVILGGEAEAEAAYGYDEMRDPESSVDWGLPFGLLRNGAALTAGVARLDVRDLCGERAGHLNVTGQAGRATKSSFLTLVVRSLIEFARNWDDGDPAKVPFSVRPIVFNTKGNDLMYLDLPNRNFRPDHRTTWEQMGITPEPFTNAEFRAPCRVMSENEARAIPRVMRKVPPERQTRSYYWGLGDVIGCGLWPYLFSDDTQQSEAMMALADHLLGLLAEDCPADTRHPAGLTLRAPGDQAVPQSFRGLQSWLHDALRNPAHVIRDHGVHTFATCRALLSRMSVVLSRDGTSIFDPTESYGAPLNALAEGTTDPLVIDIAELPTELRRFVVAAVLEQIKEQQTSMTRVAGQVYLLVLDELGIYAPKGARDAITKLFEHVAGQLRSQGIILLGAQQQASKVSETIFGNSEIKALGCSSPVELESPTWNHLLTPAQKSRALMLQPKEKMVLTGRGWMNVVVPFPAWAMKESEIDWSSVVEPNAVLAATSDKLANGNRQDGTTARDPFPLNLPQE